MNSIASLTSRASVSELIVSRTSVSERWLITASRDYKPSVILRNKGFFLPDLFDH